MHRFFSLACAVAAATSLAVACGSSDDSSSGNNGGSSGSGGSSSAAKCAAPAYADVASSDFASKADTSKACSGDSDLADLCNQDLAGLGASCGKTCLLQAKSDDASQAACVSACIDQGFSSGATPLSDGCMSCYTADVACARKNCLGPCATNPTSSTCQQCRIDMGCLPAFYDCSGAPVPAGIDLGSGNMTGEAGSGS